MSLQHFTSRNQPLEILESRVVPANVAAVWVGGAGGSGDWSDPANWKDHVVPNDVLGTSYDVTINVTGSPVITISATGPYAIHSLVAHNAVTIEGGSLTLEGGGTSSINATLALHNGSLIANGVGTTFTATGPTQVAASSLLAQAGATLSLPSLTNYAPGSDGLSEVVTWQADGPNSKLVLANLTSIANGTDAGDRLNLQATLGGALDLHNVVTLIDPNSGNLDSRSIYVGADGSGSTVNLTALTSFQDYLGGTIDYGNPYRGDDYSQLVPANSGVITAPNLSLLRGIYVSLGSTSGLTVAKWASVLDSQLDFSNASFAFPALKTATGTKISLSGGGVSLNLGELLDLSRGSLTLTGGATATVTKLANVNSTNLYVNGGATLALPAVTGYAPGADGISEVVTWQAEGTGSKLVLANLATVSTGTDAGDRLYLQATLAGTVDLHSVTTLLDPNTGNPDSRSIYVGADGSGSTVNLTALTSFQDYLGGTIDYNNPYRGDDYSQLIATNSGVITAPNLTSLRGLYVSLGANPGLTFSQWASVLDSQLNLSNATFAFSALKNAAGTEISLSGAGASLALGELLDLSRGSLTLTGGATANLAKLSNISSTNLYVNGGATLALPMATGYAPGADGIAEVVTWQAEGPGSKLVFANLAGIANGTDAGDRLYIKATLGATVDLHSVTTLVDPNSGNLDSRSIYVGADGGGSSINLTALTSFQDYLGGTIDYNNPYRGDDYSQLIPANGGVITAPNLTSLRGIYLTLGASPGVAFSQWASVLDSQLDLSNATFAFPALKSAVGTDFALSGSGVSLNLSALLDLSLGSLSLSGGATANVTKLANISNANLSVSSGSTLSLPAVTGYAPGSDGISEVSTWQADGPGSRLALPNLVSIANGTDAGDRLYIKSTLGAGIDLHSATTLLDPNSGNLDSRSIYVGADGSGSSVNLTALTSFQDYLGGTIDYDNPYRGDDFSQLIPANGGVIIAPSLSTLRGVYVSVGSTGGFNGTPVKMLIASSVSASGVAVAFPALTALTGDALTASGGAKLYFPTATTFTGAGLKLSADGSGSLIDLGKLSTFSGTGTQVAPTNFGHIVLAGNVSVSDGVSTNDFQLDDTSGVLDLNGVKTLAHTSVTVSGSGSYTLPATWAPVLGAGVSFNTSGTGKIVNLATLTASGAAVAINTGSFSNQGALKPVSGGSFNFSGDFLLDQGGSVLGDGSGTLSVIGNLGGSGLDQGASNGAALFVKTKLQVSGSRPASAPQTLEVMSQDMGKSNLGFFSQFTYYTLEVTNSSALQLVNNKDNVPNTGGEAVYVDTLIVQDGSTLDLNGLPLYAHHVVKNGTGKIVNGTVNMDTTIVVQPLTISVDKTTATFVEPDRDTVTIKITGGKFDPNADPMHNGNLKFTESPDGRGLTLSEIDLTGANYNGASIKITASGANHPTVAPALAGGFSTSAVAASVAPSADIGFLNAYGVNLGTVSIVGALHSFKGGSGDPLKPALKVFSVTSLGDGTLDLAHPDFDINGSVGRINVLQNVTGAEFNVSKGVAQFVVAGRISNSHFTVANALGTFSATGGIDHTTIDALDGLGFFNIGSAKVKSNADTVSLNVAKTLNKFTVNGAVTGASRFEVMGKANTLQIGGAVTGATFTLHDTLTSFTAGGALTGGSVLDVAKAAGTIRLAGAVDHSILTLRDKLTSLSLGGATSALTLNVTGKGGTVTAAAPLTASSLVFGGALTTFKATKGLATTTLTVPGDLGTLAVTGTADGLHLTVGGKLGAFTATGAIDNAQLTVAGTVKMIKAGAGLRGSTFDLESALTTLAVTGAIEESHLTVAGTLGALSATGAISQTTLDVTGAATTIKAGGLQTDNLTLHSSLAALTVIGNIDQSNVHVGASLKTLSVTASKTGKGDVTGSVFTAHGKTAPAKQADAVGFGTVSVAGKFAGSKILAGYDLTGKAAGTSGNADAAIGSVVIKGDFQGSTIAAGVRTSRTDGVLGTTSDLLIGGGSASIVAKIAAISVGSITGGAAGAVVAEEIGSFKVGSSLQTMMQGPSNDLDPTKAGGVDGVLYHEVDAT